MKMRVFPSRLEQEASDMQKLQFEPAWDRTIADKDRKWIEHMFKEHLINKENGGHFTFLREAINHKGELLVTVLIHNFDESPLSLKSTIISYEDEKQEIIGTFDVPYEIPGKTSIPWTFIFPSSSSTKSAPDYKLTRVSGR